MPFQWTNKGGAWIDVARDLQDMDNARQLAAMREQQARIQQAEEDRAAQSARIKSEADKLALRGQILGPVETQEDYRRALSEVKRLGLPTADLPDEIQSTAWQTFRAQPARPEARVAPSWVPEQWAPGGSALLAPEVQPEAPLPTGTMESAADLASVQRAAERGLPILQQTKMQEGDLNRSLRAQELASRDTKYQTQLELARQSAELQRMIANARNEYDREKLAIAKAEVDIKRGQLAVDQRNAAATEKAATAGQKPTENQGKAILFGQEISASLREFRDLLEDGFDPTKLPGAFGVSVAGAEGLASPFRALAGPKAQRWNNAADQLSQAALRYESGAAIGEQEFGKKIRANIPRFGDSRDLVRRKMDAIERARQAFEWISGQSLPAASPTPTEAEWNAAWSAAKPGDVVTGPDGKKYKKGGR